VFSALEQSSNDPARAISLWLALEIELRQFKQATKVFELAIAAFPKTISLSERYISFCLERAKFSNAKKLVLRAIESVPVYTCKVAIIMRHRFLGASAWFDLACSVCRM
jgi:uncharacterized metal-binding protein